MNWMICGYASFDLTYGSFVPGSPNNGLRDIHRGDLATRTGREINLNYSNYQAKPLFRFVHLLIQRQQNLSHPSQYLTYCVPETF